MSEATNHSTDLSVIVTQMGHVLVFQGRQQALFIQREHVPRFLESPQLAAVLVIPPFAATALACYTAMEARLAITLTQDPSHPSEFSFLISTPRGFKILYSSDHGAIAGPRLLAKQGIAIAITPMSVSAVNGSGPHAVVSTIASIPHPQAPNYPKRFATNPSMIKEAIEDAFLKTNSTSNHVN